MVWRYCYILSTVSSPILLLRISCRAADGECVRSYSHAVVVDMIESHDTQLGG